MLYWHLFPGQKEGLFLIDFCYFVNLSTILQVKGIYLQNASSQMAPYLFSSWGLDKKWWQSSDLSCAWELCLVHHQLRPLLRMSHECYCGEMSPYFDHILCKIATKNKTKCLSCLCQVWQNCLMLHSLDRLTSLFLHALAPLTLHVIRFDSIIMTIIVIINQPHHDHQPSSSTWQWQSSSSTSSLTIIIQMEWQLEWTDAAWDLRSNRPPSHLLPRLAGAKLLWIVMSGRYPSN